MSDRAMADTNCTYFLCPEASCTLFTHPETFPCEHDCPHAARMQKAVVCVRCKTVIKLPADHCSFERVDCSKCGVINWQRMSSVYRRVNV